MSTTSIASLPIASQTPEQQLNAPQAQQQNIQLQLSEQNQQIPNAAANLAASRDAELRQRLPTKPMQPTHEQQNTLVTHIQQAAQTGALKLPSRDIPTTQEHLTTDPNTQPNYVAPVKNTDYISEEEKAHQELLSMKQADQNVTPELWHQEFQAPLLTAALYFAFQQPFVQKKFLKLSKGMLGEDGNPTLAGHLSGALVFAALYFGSTKLIQHLTI